MNQREKKTTATKTNRTGIAKFMQLVGGLPALVSKQSNKPLTDDKAYYQAINPDFLLPDSDASHYSPNPLASSCNLSGLTTPRHEANSALHSTRQDLKMKQ